jgi:hypothetical protein
MGNKAERAEANNVSEIEVPEFFVVGDVEENAFLINRRQRHSCAPRYLPLEVVFSARICANNFWANASNSF